LLQQWEPKSLLGTLLQPWKPWSLLAHNDFGSNYRNADLGNRCCLCYSFRVSMILLHSSFEPWLSTK
jgi:hypothetical protein